MIAKEEEFEKLRAAGRALSEVLKLVARAAVPGVTAAELDMLAEREIRARRALPSFLNYKPQGARSPYPAALCVSINDEVVHGIPAEGKVLGQGDIVSLDLGLSLDGYFMDSAVTVCVGECTPEDKKLIDATREALAVGIKAAKAGGHVGDIGAAVQAVALRNKLGIVEELGGHAVGKAVHEKPYIGNTGAVGQGEKLPEGIVLALEPIFAVGRGDITLDPDGWTYRTHDGTRAAHFEQTILVTSNGAEILTAF